jgi:hypothetical protein
MFVFGIVAIQVLDTQFPEPPLVFWFALLIVRPLGCLLIVLFLNEIPNTFSVRVLCLDWGDSSYHE